MSVISVQNLTKKYKNHRVLDEISLSIDSPGIWALVGPNGVGKTTFLNTVTNILSADSGTVQLVGKSNKDASIFKEVSFLQDNTILFEYLTGYDHLKYICDVQKLPRGRIRDVAAYVGMETYLLKKVGDYSLGMKQHLLMAMAIMNDPKLLFLDEPLNGLDPTSAILMRRILLELAEKGTTVILSSHNLAEIDRVTKQILFLKDGKLMEVDMSEHETTSYYFTFSHVEMNKALGLLKEKNYSFDDTKEGVKLQLNEEELDEVISLIKSESIKILDIKKEISGSEKLYEEIFGV